MFAVAESKTLLVAQSQSVSGICFILNKTTSYFPIYWLNYLDLVTGVCIFPYAVDNRYNRRFCINFLFEKSISGLHYR